MSGEREWLNRLDDILERIKRIQDFVDDMDYVLFMKGGIVIDGLERNLEIIGEAARYIPLDVRDENNDIPWAEMISVRNRLAHDYARIDKDVLWNIVQHELNDLGEGIYNMKQKYTETK